jgi:hypothetical protein
MQALSLVLKVFDCKANSFGCDKASPHEPLVRCKVFYLHRSLTFSGFNFCKNGFRIHDATRAYVTGSVIVKSA